MLSRSQWIARPFSRLSAYPSSSLSRFSTMAYTYVNPKTSSGNIISQTSVDTPSSSPPAGHISVKWLAAGVDTSDLMTNKPMTSKTSDVAGTEGVGIVTAVGPGVTVMETGDHVVPIKMGLGTWCEAAQVSAMDVMRVPSQLRTELAATLPGSPVTAMQLMRSYCNSLNTDDVIMHIGPDNGVGTALAQLSKVKQLKLISIINDTDDELEAKDYAPTIERLKLQGSFLAIGQSYLEKEQVTTGIMSVFEDLPKPKVVFIPAGYDVVKNDNIIPKNCKIITYTNDDNEKSEFSLKQWMSNAGRDQIEDTVDQVVQLMQQGSLTGWLQRVKFEQLADAVKHGGTTRRKLVAMIQ